MPRGRRQERTFDPTLSDGVIAVLFLILTAIVTLSFFGRAGVVGTILNEYVLSFLFGNLRYITPIILITCAWYLIREKKEDEPRRGLHVLGYILFFVSSASLLHMKFSAPDMWREALAGAGGGVAGMLAYPLSAYLGGVASYIILAGLALISVFFIFERALQLFISLLRKIFSSTGNAASATFSRVRNGQNVKIKGAYDEFEDEDATEEEEEDGEERETTSSFAARSLKKTDEESEEDVEAVTEEHTSEEEEEEPEEEKSSGDVWSKRVIIKNLPPVDILIDKKSKPTSGDIKGNAETIRSTLGEFGIDVDMGEIRVGPTVTQYSLKPSKGVKLSRITALSNDLALALAAHPIRIEAPIPGQALVGIEVPNQKTAMVSFRELLESKEFKHRPHNLSIALGKDVAGKVWFADLPRMPHLLIAGATGSGKTVCVNTIIMSLLFENTAETLRMIMVDPKRVELTLYNGIPHLLTPVITNTQQTINALKWSIGEMERRFELLASAGSRDITSYNAKHPDNKIPHIVFIIDELADLMATAANEIEAGIIRLAQMARAVGIHLVVATQRPSVDVITGLMKANIPGRIAFSVASLIDSRTILDCPGAEKLIGRGDMLYLTAELGKPVRIQGAFISEEEMKDVVDYLRGDEEPEYDESIISQQKSGTMSLFGGPSDDKDPLFEDAKREIVTTGKASSSLLQRRLKVGYARAARLMDELEEAGVIGPGSGAKPREILMTKDQLHGTIDAGAKLNVFKAPTSAPQIDDEIDETVDEEVSSEENEPVEEELSDFNDSTKPDDQEDENTERTPF
ncbi:MAG TPA: DNA translocase FtsK 4TM domain-containing protein [Candidatus Magasanikbacteria bacterium]|nr:DNA translocase FtsK 4TM domain-containing protein [Candidatus Magasanikbacteria bacterium]